MVEMELNKIIIDEKRSDQIIVLKEKNGERVLPIVIGFLEVSSIKMKLSGVKPPRPLTHDLLFSVVESLNARIEKVLIDKLEDSTFHAKLFLNTENGQPRIVDARPSDCVSLSVRAKAPIYVEEEVLAQTNNLNQ